MTSKQILKIDLVQPGEDAIQAAVASLQRGDLVVAPTETRYGLLVRADDDAALEKAYDAKGRGLLRPTSLFVQDRDDLDEYGDMTAAARVLTREFLPGPLTLVLASRKLWGPPRVVNGLIGLRWSSSPVIDRLLAMVQFPVTATSANLAGAEELDTVEEIEAVFGPRVSVYLDGGPLRNTVSSVVQCVGNNTSILREGAIPSRVIEEALEGAALL